MHAFLVSVEADRLHALWRLLLTTGMRREEVIALRWSDIDLQASTVTVEWAFAKVGKRWVWKRPKSHPRARHNAGCRKLALDAKTVAALKAWRSAQLGERLAAGPSWTEDVGYLFEYPDGRPTQINLVFRQPNGAPHRPDYYSDRFARLARKAELPPIRFHDIRHSYATMMLASGTHVKIVSQRLGHTTIAQTLDLYSWCLPAHDEQAAVEGAAILEAAGGGPIGRS